MARVGRKQLAVQIKEESFTTLEQIKEETGLSNAKIIEMLIENYQSANINTSTNTTITEEQLRKILKEELACININTSTQKTINTNINTSTKPKTKIKPPANRNIMPVEDDEEEHVPFIEAIVDIPEWQKKEITQEDFYGKVPEPPKNDDPIKWVCEPCSYEWSGTNGDIMCPRCQSVFIDEKE